MTLTLNYYFMSFGDVIQFMAHTRCQSCTFSILRVNSVKTINVHVICSNLQVVLSLVTYAFFTRDNSIRLKSDLTIEFFSFKFSVIG